MHLAQQKNTDASTPQASFLSLPVEQAKSGDLLRDTRSIYLYIVSICVCWVRVLSSFRFRESENEAIWISTTSLHQTVGTEHRGWKI